MGNQELKSHLVQNGLLWGPEQHPYAVSGLMTYGPAGKSIKTKLEAEFRDEFNSQGFEEIETSILLPTEAWQASGHLEAFGDEMFHTHTPSGRELTARPELATSIYPLFDQLHQYYGQLPFRVYQTGAALPNDKQTEWQLRTRQYTAHEGHIFAERGDVNVEETLSYLSTIAMQTMDRAGIDADTLRFREKQNDDTPFYATRAFGLYTSLKNGDDLELLGIQYRGSRDFERHSAATGAKLSSKGDHPEVFEISFSTDRPFYTLMERSLRKRDEHGVLDLPRHLAPATVLIGSEKHSTDTTALPQLCAHLGDLGVDVMVGSKKSVGQYYRRADAIGIPYVITPGKNEDTFLIRDRDERERTTITMDEIKRIKNAAPTDTNTVMSNLFTFGS